MGDEDGSKLCELERLLNDPDVPMSAVRIWELASEIADENASIAHFDAGSAHRVA